MLNMKPEKGDESQPPSRNLFKAHYLYIYNIYISVCVCLPLSLYDTTCLHVPFLHTCPCFATLRHSFLGITLHPLANCLAPNPNGAALRWALDPDFFQYVCLYVPSFFNALPVLHFIPFFQTFSCVFRRFFQSFLPAISAFSQRFPQFPWFFQACHEWFFQHSTLRHSFLGKPSCSEPQRTLLSVELRILSFSICLPLCS